MKTRPPRQRRPLGRLLRGLALVAVVVLVLRTWCVQGLFVAVEVTGSSMAGTLVGVHQEVRCGDCGLPFDCSAEAGPLQRPTVCPNCGFTGTDVSDLPLVAGDRVLVNRLIYQFRRPRRWELAAFRHPHDPKQLCVKRVVGLGGESLEIRDGEVIVNGQIARKGLAEQRAVAVLVHDADHAPARVPTPPPRWLSEPEGRWDSLNGRFVHATAGKPDSIDWLTYRHWSRLPGTEGQVREGPITNRSAYNQDRPPHPANVYPVRDVRLSFRLVRLAGPGRLVVRATDGADEFRVWIDPVRGRYEVIQRDRPVASGDDLPGELEGSEIEVSLVDRQILLAVDGRMVACHPFEASDRPAEPTSRPLAIGAEALAVEIRHVRVYRDVYYTHPPGAQGRWGVAEPVVLGPDEYFALGDNSSVSSDSRTWAGGPAITASLLVGKPMLVHYPARRIELGRLGFQVPDPAEIRYIR